MMMNKTRTLGVDKFDVVVMNPPYQELKPGNKKSFPLWDKFVNKCIDLTIKTGGYLVAVHPAGWRNTDGVFKYLQQLIMKKQLLYLEMHSIPDGLKTFGAETRYDFYCLKNSPNEGNFITKIKCQDGKIERLNISKMEFIPSGMFNEFKKLLAKPGEEKVEVLYSRSDYGTDKKNMSKIKTDEFKYPVVYRVRKDDSVDFWYSNTNENGHFGISKLIWSDGRVKSVGSYIDDKGKYALNQFQFAIVDKTENLPNIKKAFDSKQFRALMENCAVSNLCINRKAISLFRKDFWVDFLDYNNDDE